MITHDYEDPQNNIPITTDGGEQFADNPQLEDDIQSVIRSESSRSGDRDISFLKAQFLYEGTWTL